MDPSPREKNAIFLARALTLAADAGFDAEAHSGTHLCAATRHSAPLARATHLVSYAHGRCPLEYCIKIANQHRAAWLMDRCGAQALAWDPPPAHQSEPPRWRLQLFEVPPLDGDFYFELRRAHWPLWPAPEGAALARAMLAEKAGGAPHGGFVMPPQVEPEHGFGPRIVGPIEAWRAANPSALAANVWGRADLADDDFAHFTGVRALWMSDCNQAAVTDAAFVHLRGIHTLDMRFCDQATITVAALTHLRGIHTLDMRDCYKVGSGEGLGVAFAGLRGVRLLLMRGCSDAVIAAARVAGLPVDSVTN